LCIRLLSNSEPGRYRTQPQTAPNRHGLQRICIFRSAVTTHPVALTSKRENPAEVNVVTSEQEIEDRYEGRHKLFAFSLPKTHATRLPRINRRKFVVLRYSEVLRVPLFGQCS